MTTGLLRAWRRQLPPKLTHWLLESPLMALLATSVLILGLAAFLGPGSSSVPSHDEKGNQAVKPPSSLDVLLTPGQVLVPLELANHQSLDSLLGPYGIVDLYPLDSLQRKARRPLARYVRIVRSQSDSRHFAALLPSSQAPFLLQGHALLYAVVHHPDILKPPEFHGPKQKARQREIIIESSEELEP